VKPALRGRNPWKAFPPRGTAPAGQRKLTPTDTRATRK
jgi:hypothetical protein